MANAFPVISGGSVAKYPLTRHRIQRGAIATFLDFSEQRFSKGVPLNDFELTWSKIPTADKDAIRDFFNARLGAFDTTWQITIEDPPGSPTTFQHMQFIPKQQFEAKEESTGLWSFSLKIRQTRRA